MFDPDYELPAARHSQWAIAGLTVLCLLSLVANIWILADVNREQSIIKHLTQHLPAADRPEAYELANALRLQSRLSIVLIANLIGCIGGLTLLIYAYLSSQRSLRNVHVLASDILASLDQGVITTDQQAAILSINPRGRELLAPSMGGTEVAYIKMPLNNLSPDHHPLEEICREVLETQEHIRDRDYVCRSNGTVQHLRAGCCLLRDHDGEHRGTVIHLRDVTEKTLMEQRLRRMERYMGLGSLAAGLQHEIKNPLSALSLHVQLLQESLEHVQTSSQVQQSLDVLAAEVSRITNVLDSFRDFASIAQLNRTATGIRRMIEKLVTLTEPKARQQGIDIQTDIPAEDVPPVVLDAIRIEQVLLNLILNAMAAMPEGGTITISVRYQSDQLEIDISDTGGGIPSELRDKVFDPYFTTQSTGTGMGLALCEKIVRQHEGTIDFVSGAKGTVFTVTLPGVAIS